MKKIRTWIMIADGARAHIVLNEGAGKGISPVLERETEDSRVPSRDLVTDRPGRSSLAGGGSRHAMEPRMSWHTYEKHQFAEKMGRLLAAAAKRNRFDRLVLVAPPEILGVLRASLDEPTRRIVVGELAKDLTQVPLHDLPGRLGDVINV